MDANGTRFHLLLGESDWSRCRTVGGRAAFGADKNVFWNAPRNEVTLWPDTFRFPTPRAAMPLAVDSRRGAARDRFENWYWISPDERSIQVLSSGSRAVSQFWPALEPAAPAPKEEGGFRARDAVVHEAVTLRGLTVTED